MKYYHIIITTEDKNNQRIKYHYLVKSQPYHLQNYVRTLAE